MLTHRAEHFSQIKDIFETLRTANHNFNDELSNTAENLESITESENMNPEEVKEKYNF